MCRLIFETVKWLDGVPHLLEWHQRRVEISLARLGRATRVPDLQLVLASSPVPEDSGLYKCHITYDEEGVVHHQPVFSPYVRRRVKALKCVNAVLPDYSCKWEDRAALEALGSGLGEGEEVLLLHNSYVTDTRYSNVAFWDGKIWVTPETFLLPGTKRAFLLSQGLIQERPVHVNQLADFQCCSLLNAMLDPGDVVIDMAHIR